MARSTIVLAALTMGVSTLAFAQTPVTPVPGAAAAPAAVAAPAKATDATTVAPPALAQPAKAATADNVNMTQQITNKLTASGFTDVKVIPESFFIQAKDKAGDQVSVIMEHGSMMIFTTADAQSPDAKPAPSGMFADIPVNEDLSSKLVGLDIYSANNQKIGTIKDIAFGAHGVKAYIVGVGGFLGMGDHYVAIRPAAIKIGYTASDKKWHATMETTAADLKAAPEYKYVSNS